MRQIIRLFKTERGGKLRSKLQVLVLALTVILQSGVLYFMIRENEHVRRQGELYLFKIESNYPAHSIAGKYIELNFSMNRVTIPPQVFLPKKKNVWVLLGVDSAGFAYADSLIWDNPPSPKGMVKARISDMFFDAERGWEVSLKFPFASFYLDEIKAEQAGNIYNAFRPDTTAVYHAGIRIMGGKGVVESVFLNNKRIEEYLK